MTFTIDAPVGAMLGVGYNEATFDLRSVAAIGDIGMDDDASGNLSTDFHFGMVTSSSDLAKSMAISAGASVRTLNFGAKAQIDFRERVSVSSQSTNILLRIAIMRRPRRLINARLIEDGNNLLAMLPPRTERFHERFGSHFVRQIVSGGVFYGVARIESESEEKQEELGVDVSLRIGNVLGGSVNSSNDFSENFNSSTDRIEMHIMAIGGSPRPVFNIDQLMSEISLFEQEVTNGVAVPITAEMSPFNQLTLPSDDVTFVQEQVARALLDELGENFQEQVELRNQIDFVLRNRDAFQRFNVQTFRDALNECNRNLNRIASAADNCARDRELCVLPQDIAPPSLVFPERKTPVTSPREPREFEIGPPVFQDPGGNHRVDFNQLVIAHQVIPRRN
ncbi:MAC/Perforin domain-containing protein [Roseivivax lentus]|uniref:MAC/Perforin domain-containing protein n=1 Tax=Roseivivax lentus TaxID=633194 RepID=A0A1N7PNN9_9RHOB|nr:MAC/perforin domain-containing protein [Roseivivax lentus]SIT12201.1 MAC/Perforin domain-containing protein [Roseivivax lentus]